MNSKILNLAQVKRMYENTGVEFFTFNDASMGQVDKSRVNARKAKVDKRLSEVESFMAETKKPVTSKILSKEFGVSVTTAFKDINELLEANLIRLVGGKSKDKKYIYAKIN